MTLPEKLEALETVLRGAGLPPEFADLCRERMAAGHHDNANDSEAVDLVQAATEEQADTLCYYALGVALGKLNAGYRMQITDTVQRAVLYIGNAARPRAGYYPAEASIPPGDYLRPAAALYEVHSVDCDGELVACVGGQYRPVAGSYPPELQPLQFTSHEAAEVEAGKRETDTLKWRVVDVTE